MPWPEEPTSDVLNFDYVSPEHMDILHNDNVDDVDVHPACLQSCKHFDPNTAHLYNDTNNRGGCGQDNGIPLRVGPSTSTSVATPDRWGTDAATPGRGGIDATPSTHGSDTRLKRPATQAAPS
eukprot:1386632-Rhodomonas_salina.1